MVSNRQYRFDSRNEYLLEYFMYNSGRYLLTCLIFLLISSCDQKPKNPVSDYGNALIGGYKGSKVAAEQANLDAVQKSVDAYHAANDKYPDSLKDVEPLLAGTQVDFTKYDYDPRTGRVTLKAAR
jgi:hypothetical protein